MFSSSSLSVACSLLKSLSLFEFVSVVWGSVPTSLICVCPASSIPLAGGTVFSLVYSCLLYWSLIDHKESDSTERLHFHFSLSCIGEGNGNPLQCSCLENPRDDGAWWAAVCGVSQSRTWLKWLSSSSSILLNIYTVSWCSSGFCDPLSPPLSAGEGSLVPGEPPA